MITDPLLLFPEPSELLGYGAEDNACPSSRVHQSGSEFRSEVWLQGLPGSLTALANSIISGASVL